MQGMDVSTQTERDDEDGIGVDTVEVQMEMFSVGRCLRNAISAHYESEALGAIIRDPERAAQAIMNYMLARSAKKKGDFERYGAYLLSSARYGYKLAHLELRDWYVEKVQRMLPRGCIVVPESAVMIEELKKYSFPDLIHSRSVALKKRDSDPMYS